MMIHPEGYIDMIEDKSYENLLKERDALIAGIRLFESTIHKSKNKEWMMSPSPDVEYQRNLMCLAKLCELIHKTYNKVYVWSEVE